MRLPLPPLVSPPGDRGEGPSETKRLGGDGTPVPGQQVGVASEDGGYGERQEGEHGLMPDGARGGEDLGARVALIDVRGGLSLTKGRLYSFPYFTPTSVVGGPHVRDRSTRETVLWFCRATP